MMHLDVKDKEMEERQIYADMDFICSNLTRVAILHLLMKSSLTDYSLNVEKIAYHLGKHHKIILQHLEKLKEYGIVQVIKVSKSGKRRRIWGLNKEKIELIKKIYSYAIRNYFTQAQLEKACNVNKKVR